MYVIIYSKFKCSVHTYASNVTEFLNKLFEGREFLIRNLVAVHG